MDTTILEIDLLTDSFLLPGCGPREGRSLLRVPVWSTQASTTAQLGHAVPVWFTVASAPIGRAPHTRAQEEQASAPIGRALYTRDQEEQA